MAEPWAKSLNKPGRYFLDTDCIPHFQTEDGTVYRRSDDGKPEKAGRFATGDEKSPAQCNQPSNSFKAGELPESSINAKTTSPSTPPLASGENDPERSSATQATFFLPGSTITPSSKFWSRERSKKGAK